MFPLKSKCLLQAEGCFSKKAVCLLKNSVTSTRNKVEKSFLFWGWVRFWCLPRNNSREPLVFIWQHLLRGTVKAVSSFVLPWVYFVVSRTPAWGLAWHRVLVMPAIVILLPVLRDGIWYNAFVESTLRGKISLTEEMECLSLQDRVFQNSWACMACSFLLHWNRILCEGVWEGGCSMSSAQGFFAVSYRLSVSYQPLMSSATSCMLKKCHQQRSRQGNWARNPFPEQLTPCVRLIFFNRNMLKNLAL